MKSGGSTSLTISYDTSDNDAFLTGLGLRVHFDSSVLTYVDASDVATIDIISLPYMAIDIDDYDNDPSTDYYIAANWASLFGNWPGSLPKDLMTLNFNVAEGLELDDYTMINFSSPANTAGYIFNANTYTLPQSSGSWDFDENGNIDALTDGLLLLRYAFGLRGEFLSENTVAENSPLTASEIQSNIENSESFSDIDGNGEINPLTDGLLLLRYLFGMNSDDLIKGIIHPDGTRQSSEEIIEHINNYMVH